MLEAWNTFWIRSEYVLNALYEFRFCKGMQFDLCNAWWIIMECDIYNACDVRAEDYCGGDSGSILDHCLSGSPGRATWNGVLSGNLA